MIIVRIKGMAWCPTQYELNKWVPLLVLVFLFTIVFISLASGQ